MKSIILIISLITSATLFASSTLPTDWYQPSFDKGANQNTLSTPSAQADEEIDHLFSTQHKTLKRLNKNANKKWKVTDYVFMLALSKSGLLGFKALNGKSVFQVYYQKKKATPVKVEESKPIDIFVHEDMTDSDLQAQIEPVLGALVATKKIDRNTTLSGDIVERINSVKQVVGNLEASTDKKFYLSAFRIDLGINSSGILLPSWAAHKGTEVVLRLQWTRIVKKGAPKALAYKSKVNSNFQAFTESVLKDLNKIDESPLASTGKKAVKVRIGMGVTTTDAIIISSAKTTFMGNLIFKRNKKYKPSKSVVTNDYQYVIDKSIDGAKKMGQISNERFIKGLNKAVKMGGYFVRKADNSKKWKVSMLRAWYILSVQGFMGLAPITATSEIELFYK